MEGCLARQKTESDPTSWIVSIGIDQRHRLPGPQSDSSVYDRQRERWAHQCGKHMIATVARRSVLVLPWVCRRKQARQRPEQVLAGTRANFDQCQSSRGVREKYVDQAVAVAVAEAGDMIGQIDNPGLISGPNLDNSCFHGNDLGRSSFPLFHWAR